MITNVVVVGRGVAVAALQFVYLALLKDEQAVMASRFGMTQQQMKDTTVNGGRMRLSNLAGALNHHLAGGATASVKVGRRMKCLTTVDPIAAASVVADLDPASTLVISLALLGTEETGRATLMLKNWLLKGLTSTSSTSNTAKFVDSILAKHMILVTGNDRIAASIHKPESVYVVPVHARCEPFTSSTVATLLVCCVFLSMVNMVYVVFSLVRSIWCTFRLRRIRSHVPPSDHSSLCPLCLAGRSWKNF